MNTLHNKSYFVGLVFLFSMIGTTYARESSGLQGLLYEKVVTRDAEIHYTYDDALEAS